MSSIRINTPEALKRYLQILAEESVNSAYASEVEYQKKHSPVQVLDEADPEEKEDSGDDEDPLFGDEEGGDKGGGEEDPLFGDEDGGEEGGDEPAPEEMPEDPEDDAGLDVQKQQGDAYAVKPTPMDLELGKISVEGIAGTLNLIRAGRSYKDADVAEQLRKYVESLSDAEQLAMGTFLSALRDIAVGETADEIPEPGEPAVDIKISPTGNSAGDQGQEQQQPQQAGQEQQQSQVGQQPQQPMSLVPRAGEADPEELEDTEAPIKVASQNGVQLAAHHERDMQFRQHIKELLEKSR